MTPTPAQSCIADELDRIAGIVSRGYGIDIDPARLIVMQCLGGIAGGTLTTRNVEAVNCSQAFDLAVIGGGGAMVHGAQVALLDPVLGEFQSAADRAHLRGGEHASLLSRDGELESGIRAAQEKLDALNAVPISPEENTQRMADLSFGGNQARQQQRITLAAALESLRKERLTVQQQLVDGRFLDASGIVRDGGGWAEFPSAGRQCFDGHFLQLATADSLIEEVESLPSSWFRHSAELFRRSRRQTPLSGMAISPETTTCAVQITGDHFAIARLLRDSKLGKSGFFNGFVICEAAVELSNCDPDAIALLAEDDWWAATVELMLTHRLNGYRHSPRLDRAGVNCCLDFREWHWNFMANVPEEHQWAFRGWPELAVTFALILATMQDGAGDQILDVRYLKAASAMLQEHAPRQAAILGSLTPAAEEKTTDQLEVQIGRLMQRLQDHGPMTRRELVRTFNGQDYGVIDALLAEAMRRGRIIQRNRRYAAADVSVNASAVGDFVEFPEGVAA